MPAAQEILPAGHREEQSRKPVWMRGTTDQRTQISQLVPTASYDLESNVSRPRDRQVERVIELGVDASDTRPRLSRSMSDIRGDAVAASPPED
jgi:hypothetical protein